jgi:hypothetical protein
VIASGHGAVIGFAFDDIDTEEGDGKCGARGEVHSCVDLHAIEEVGPPVLTVERLCGAWR